MKEDKLVAIDPAIGQDRSGVVKFRRELGSGAREILYLGTVDLTTLCIVMLVTSIIIWLYWVMV